MAEKLSFNPLTGKFDLVSDLSDYQTKVDAAVTGNIASLDVNGQVVDSGLKLNDAGTSTTDILSASQVLTRIANLPVGVGSGVSLYLTADAAGIGSYDLMSKTPDAVAEVVETALCTGGGSGTYGTPVLIDGYIASQEIGSTSLTAGGWTFNLYGSVSSNNADAAFQVDVYTYSAGAVETLLFSTTSGVITGTVAVLTSMETVQPAFVVASTDKILFKIYGKITGNSTRTVSLYHSGTEHYSHATTPLVESHNNLIGLQGGQADQYYHLTLAQKTAATQNASALQQGLLSATDWAAFNGKQGLTLQAVQTANFIAVKSSAYPCDTTSSAITVTLPAAPSAGDQVQLTDYAGTFAANNLTVNPNGLKVNGGAANVVYALARLSIVFTYVDATQGWLVTSGVNESAGGGGSVTVTYQANSLTFPASPAAGDVLLVTSDGTYAGTLEEHWIYSTDGWYQVNTGGSVVATVEQFDPSILLFAGF